MNWFCSKKHLLLSSLICFTLEQGILEGSCSVNSESTYHTALASPGTCAGSISVSGSFGILSDSSALLNTSVGTVGTPFNIIGTGPVTISGSGGGGTRNLLNIEITSTSASAYISIDSSVTYQNGTVNVASEVLSSTANLSFLGTTSYGAGNISNYTIGQNGTLQFATTGTVGGNFTLTDSTSTIHVNSAQTITVSGTMSGTGGLNLPGPGNLTLTAVESYIGSTTVNAGTLALSTSGDISASNGLTLNGTSIFDISAISGAGTNVTDLITASGTTVSLGSKVLGFGTSNGTTVAGIFTGTGGIVKRGDGTVILTGANTFTGGTTINAGTLAMSSVGSLATTGSVTINGVGVFDISGISSTSLMIGDLATSSGSTVALSTKGLVFGTTNSTTLAGAITGSGTLTKQGSGTVTLSNANGLFSGPISLTAGQITVANNTAMGTGMLTMSAGTTLSVNAGISVANDVTLNGSAYVDVSSSGIGTLSGVIGGTGSVTKTGAHVLALTGANTYSGGTTVNAGTLALVSGGNLLSTGSVTLNGGIFDISEVSGSGSTVGALTTSSGSQISLGSKILTFGTSGSTTIAGTIVGTGSIVKQGTGTTTFTGSSTFSGGTTINFGSLALSGTGSLLLTGAVDINGAGIFDIGGLTGSGTTIGDLTTASGTTVALGSKTLTWGTANDTTVAGAITGAGGIVKQGSGVVTLSGASTFTGGTTINAGTLAIGSGGSLAPTGSVTVTGTSVFDISAFTSGLTIGDLTTNSGTNVALGANILTFGTSNSTTIAGTIAGSGSLVKQGTGTATLSGDNTFEGGVNLSQGQISILDNHALGTGVLAMGVGTTLSIGSLVNAVNNISLSGAVTIDVSSGETGTLSGIISGVGGTITKSGSNTLALSGANTYGGGTTINSGTVALVAGGSLSSTGTVTVNGASIFDISGITGAESTIGSLITASPSTLNLGGKTLVFGTSSNTTIGGIVTGSGGSLTKQGTGTVTISNANTFTGGVALNAGEILINNNTALGAGALTMASGTTLSVGSLVNASNSIILNGNATIDASASFAGTLSGVISGNVGSLTKTGASTLILTGANTYQGGTTVNAGTLTIALGGSLYPSGAVTINAGTFDISGITATGLTIGDLTTLSGTVVSLGAKGLTFGTSNSTTIAGTITGTGSLVKQGAGTSTLTGTNTFTGGLTINAGTLALAAPSGALTSTGSVVVNGTSIFDISGVIGSGTTIGDLTTALGSTLNLGGKALTFGTVDNTTLAGAITGSGGSLIKNGTGTVTISNANTFTGGVSLAVGEIFIANNTALGIGTLSMAGSTILSIGSGISASNAITLSGAATIDVSQGGIGTLSGIIGGTGSLSKTGTYQLDLSATNTYSGGTIIHAGTLALISGGSLLSTGAVTVNGGIFDISGLTGTGTAIGDLTTVSSTTVSLGTKSLTFGTAHDTSIAGAITGSGSLIKQGSGVVEISNANTSLIGPVFLNAGEIFITNNTALGTNTLTMAGGSILSIGSGISAANSIVLSGAATIDVSSGGKGILSGNIMGGIGSLIKTGSDELDLSGTNTFAGGTTINAGRLALINGGSLSSAGAVTVNGTSFFDISGINTAGTTIGDLTTAVGTTVALGNKSLTFGTTDNTTIAGLITGTGLGASLVKMGTGIVTISNGNSFSGGVALDAGQITIGNNTALGTGMLTMDSGTTLSIGVGVSASNPILLNGAATVDVSMGGMGTLSGNINGSVGTLTKTGANILALSGNNNYGNGTIINGGTLALILGGSLSTTGPVTINTGIFDVSGITGPLVTIGDLASLTGTTVALGNKTLTFGTNNNTTVAGIVSGGGGALLKQGLGTATFTGANTFTGGTTISSGTLALSGGGSLSSTGSVLLTGASTFDVSGITATSTTIGDLSAISGTTVNLGNRRLIFGTGNNTEIAGLITGLGGSIAKQGAGTVVLSNSNAFSGGVFLNGGNLVVESNHALGSGTLTTSDGTGLVLADQIHIGNNVDLFSGNTNITVDATNTALMTGHAYGTGGFTKEGLGTLVWDGVGVYSGTTKVDAGLFKLAFGGSIQGPVLVEKEARFQSCSNSGALAVYGTVQPGCSETNMYVNGDVEFFPGSVLQMQVGNNDHATVVVNGDVTIESGATVNFNVVHGYNRVRNTFIFLYSNGVFGHFDPSQIFINTPLIQPVITLVGPGDLQVGLNLADFSGMITDNNNAVAVGQAIYNLAAEGNPIGEALISSMIGLGQIHQIENALDEMHPALYKGLTLSQENNAVRVQDTIGYRFQQQLNEVHCFRHKSSEEQPEEAQGNELQRIQKQLKKKVKGCEKPKKQTVNLWADGFGDSLAQGAIRFAGSPQLGYQVNTGGVSLGVDGNFADYFYLGALGAYTGSSADWHSSKSKGTIDTGYAGLYFSGISDMFYGNLSVVGGWSHFSGHRSIVFPGVNQTATNSHGGSQLLSHADTGVNLGYKGFTFRPFDSFDYIAQSESGFTESGAGIYNLKVQNTSAIMLRNELGMQFAGCLCFNSSRWTIAPKFSWVLESRTKGKGYVVEFNGTDLPFDITGYFPNRSLFSPGVMISGLMLRDRLSIDLYYNGAFGEKYSENNYGGQIRYGF